MLLSKHSNNNEELELGVAHYTFNRIEETIKNSPSSFVRHDDAIGKVESGQQEA